MPGRIYSLELMVPGNQLGSILNGFKASQDRLAVTIKIPESSLGDILPQVVTHQGIRLVSCNPTGEVDQRQSGYAHGKRDKGISGRDLIVKLLTEDPRVWSGDEIGNAFVQHQFARNSWGPPMSELVKETPAKVRSLGRGMYVAAGSTVKPGDHVR